MGDIILLSLSILILVYALCLTTFLGNFFNISLETSSGFNSNLEILRGLAAFLVFLAHTTMYFGYLAPKYILSTYSGSFGVNVFFMLTAYLFWNQVIHKKIDFNKFYKKRIFRLVPIVLVVITTVTVIDFVFSNDKSFYLARCAALIKNFLFGFGGVNDVFSPDMYLRINTIWTLKWEWLFYLTLPVLAVWPRKITLLIAFILAVIAFTDITKIFDGESDVVFYTAFFLGGMSVYFEHTLSSGSRAKVISLGFLLIAIGIFALMFYNGLHGRVHYKSLLCTAGAFCVFIFFLINPFAFHHKLSSSLQLLGKVSYSFYLWHLSFNFYAITLLKKYVVDNEVSFFSNPYYYLIFGLVMVSLSLFISFFTFKYIESYFLKKGHAVKNSIYEVRV